MSAIAYYVLWWIVLMVIGILNGTLRVMGYQKYMPEIRAHQLSCLTGILFIGLAVYVVNVIRPFESARQSITIGFTWFLLTILFEFGFGRYTMKHPWKKLFNDYRVDKGRFWLLVLLWILFAPYVISHYL